MSVDARRYMEVSIDLSAEEVAALFWRLSDSEQARFFTHLATIDWHQRERQWCALAERLTKDHPSGLEAFKHLATWATEEQT